MKHNEPHYDILRAKAVADTIKAVKLVILWVIAIAFGGTTLVGIASNSIGMAAIALVTGALAFLLAYVQCGWYEHTLRMQAVMANNTINLQKQEA